MAEPETANTADAGPHADSAKGVSGDAALKAIAHLQEVAKSLAADAENLADPRPLETAKEAKAARPPSLPALAAPKARTGAAPPAAVAGWRARMGAMFENLVWSQAAAAAVLMLAVAGGAYAGLTDYLDRRETQRIAAEEGLRHPPETPAERELRGKVAELTLDLQSLRAQIGKAASDARAAQTHAANAAASASAATQTAARVEKLDKDLAARLDGQVARVERLERIAADPIVTSSIAKDQKAGQSAAVQTPARQGLRTPDPTMKPNTFVLRSVRNGMAMVQTSRGMLEVGPGDVIPGVGRVRGIEKMNGRWVLVMHDGYIDQYED